MAQPMRSAVLTATMLALTACSAASGGTAPFEVTYAEGRGSDEAHRSAKPAGAVALVSQRFRPCLKQLNATKLVANGDVVISSATVPGTILTWNVRRSNGNVYTSPDANTSLALSTVGC